MITPSELATPNPTGRVWGPKIWKKLEETVEEIPCKKCGFVGESMVKAGHDLVNIKKGSAVYDAENLHRFRRYIDAADDAARSKPGARDKMLEIMAKDMNNGEFHSAENCQSCNLTLESSTNNENDENLLPIMIVGGAFLGIVIWGLSKR